MFWKHQVAGLMLCSFCSVCPALGIDKVFGELDVARGFKSVTAFSVFNDRNQEIFVTSKGLSWDMDRSGQITTAPSNDLEIFPPALRVMPGDSATFKIRYIGNSMEGEGQYRVMFNEVLIPEHKKANDKLENIKTGGSNVGIGISITVPVYVSDLSKQERIFEGVTASYKQNGRKLSLLVKNVGGHHISIRECSVNGTPMPELGIVLSHHDRLFVLETTDTVSSVVLKLAYRDKTKDVSALRE